MKINRQYRKFMQTLKKNYGFSSLESFSFRRKFREFMEKGFTVAIRGDSSDFYAVFILHNNGEMESRLINPFLYKTKVINGESREVYEPVEEELPWLIEKLKDNGIKEEVKEEIASYLKWYFVYELEDALKQKIKEELRPDLRLDTYLENVSNEETALEYAYNYYTNQSPMAFDYFGNLEDSLLADRNLEYIPKYFYDLFKQVMLEEIEKRLEELKKNKQNTPLLVHRQDDDFDMERRDSFYRL